MISRLLFMGVILSLIVEQEAPLQKEKSLAQPKN